MGRRKKEPIPAGTPRVIKRYGNRKLYDTRESRYVTLEEISNMIRRGEDVKVVDNRTQEDLTNVTFTQIMLEQEKRRKSFLPHSLLRNLVEQGGESLLELLQKGKESLASMKSEAEEQISRLFERGSEAREEGSGLLRDWMTTPQKTLDLLQKRIDERIRYFFFHLTGLDEIEKQIQDLEQEVIRLEKRLSDS